MVLAPIRATDLQESVSQTFPGQRASLQASKTEPQAFLGRLAALDQLRALAVISMILAHFGPGVIERIPALGAYREVILFWSHFASVTFILVFGITVGFVHYERFWSADREIVLSRLRVRTALVLVCAIAIGIPNFSTQCTAGKFEFIPCLLQFYSPLDFYVLGFLSAPYWLRALGRRPIRNGIFIGGAHWLAATVVLMLWPLHVGFDAAEYIRMILVSGPFAYVQLAGCALAVMPIGIGLRRALGHGEYSMFVVALIGIGLGLTLLGWGLGHFLMEFDIHAINTGELRAPPRLWYWTFFAGPTLLLLVCLIVLERRAPVISRLLYPLSLFGMGALPIYAAHVFVRPAFDIFDVVVPIEGYGRFLLPLATFAAYCLLVMWYYHAKLHRRHGVRHPG